MDAQGALGDESLSGAAKPVRSSSTLGNSRHSTILTANPRRAVSSAAQRDGRTDFRRVNLAAHPSRGRVGGFFLFCIGSKVPLFVVRRATEKIVASLAADQFDIPFGDSSLPVPPARTSQCHRPVADLAVPLTQQGNSSNVS
jgi:hypothetical protein